MPPFFGRIREVKPRRDEVRIQYELEHLDPFLSFSDLRDLEFDLGIEKHEMNRTHWAVKDVDLGRELAAHGIVLPGWAGGRSVNIETHEFDVALSFPGEDRSLVATIAGLLERRLGPDKVFYDQNYAGQLARPSIDLLMQDIFKSRAKLVVVFIGGHYQLKEWCAVEFRAIRTIIKRRENSRVMYVKTGDNDVDGVLPHDGYLDARQYSPSEIARFIVERIDSIA